MTIYRNGKPVKKNLHNISCQFNHDTFKLKGMQALVTTLQHNMQHYKIPVDTRNLFLVSCINDDLDTIQVILKRVIHSQKLLAKEKIKHLKEMRDETNNKNSA